MKNRNSNGTVACLCTLIVVASLQVGSTFAADWPAYQHDNARTASSAENLKAPLAEAWVYRSPHRPHQAWPGPAKWDGWNKVYDLKDRMIFDKAFQVAAVGDAIYFGSSVDDKVYCLDADTGAVRWVYYTEGPVRLAPSIVDGKLYVGSDDGFVYCLQADDGKLIWKHRPGPEDRRVPGNGRIVSLWAIRSGVVRVDDTVYACAGVFPSETVYLCAMDAATGREKWKTSFKDFTAQGYMLASSSRLYVTTGRSTPLVFDRKTGKRLFHIRGGSTGGTYALLTNDVLTFGPGKTGLMAAFGEKAKDHLASFEGNHMIVTGGMSYLHTDNDLSLLDRATYIKLYSQRVQLFRKQRALGRKLKKAKGDDAKKIRAEIAKLGPQISAFSKPLRDCVKWRTPCHYPLALILTGKALFAGGAGKVAAIDLSNGREIWQADVSGNVFGLAAANGRLLVSTDNGSIHCFTPVKQTAARIQNDPRRTAATSSTALLSPLLTALATADSEPTQPVAKKAKPATGPKPRYRWVFDRASVRGSRIRPSDGTLPGRINGTQLLVGKPPAALVLDGQSTSVNISRRPGPLSLPKKAISVETWAMVNRPAQMGGLVGALQDNDDYERGFVLGFHNQNHFCFGLTAKTRARMTYLDAKSTFEAGKWYHVVGTYDGKTMNLYVNGRLEATSSHQTGDILHTSRGFFELGSFRDDNEFLRTKGMLHEVALYDTVLDEKTIRGRFEAKQGSLPRGLREIIGPFDVVHGPFIEFVRRGVLRVNWDTDEPSTSIVAFGRNRQHLKRFEDSRMTTRHSVTVTDVPRDTELKIQILGRTADGREIVTAPYDFDSTFEYLPIPTPKLTSPFPDDARTPLYQKTARAMIDVVGRNRGYVLVLGAGDGRLAYELARMSDFKIVVAEPDEAKVRELQTALDRAGLYGFRVSVVHSPLDRLPFGPYLFNLVASGESLVTGQLPGSIEEIYRVLRPVGGVAYLGEWSKNGQTKLTRAAVGKWLGKADLAEGVSRFVEDDGGLFWIHRRGKLPGSADWTHQYASPDNSSCSKDDLIRGDMTVLWWGRPGPRPMPDRGPRNPAPVSAGGRLYVQGNRTLFGLDQYNGTILWAKQTPTIRRANVPRDGSNMVATDDYLYVATRDYCIGFEGDTGKRVLKFQVPAQSKTDPYNWGYLAVVGEKLIGTTVKRGSQYKGDDGQWYEDFKPNEIDRITSDSLFVLDRHSGQKMWTYTGGVIMNSTITIADGLIYFVESRNPKAKSSKTSRLLDAVQKDQHLMAVELKTGDVRWQNPYDFSKCQFMTYISHGENTLIVMGTDKEKKFHTYAFNSRDGYKIWEDHKKAQKKHHSGHLHHPTIIGNRLYVNKHTYELSTGNVLKLDTFDWHGCGVMSASNHTIFHRFEFHGMLDLKNDKRTEFLGIRSGCWLSIIPSGGILLAPETSAGCSCSHGIQTSIAFVPKKKSGPKKTAPAVKSK